jgi:metallophosphoesterase superfamily enzyme
MKLPKNRRILVIGDLHEPFTLSGYLPFCLKIKKKYNCNVVVFLGDLVDNHYSSFHETNPDGHSAAEELERARAHIKGWHAVFPNAIVCTGNHDKIPNGKAFNASVSSTWIKSVSEVLDTPSWHYGERWLIDGVLYCHGIGRKAHTRMKNDLISVVQGHYHTDSGIIFMDGAVQRLFSVQVGCGFDSDSYAAAYAKHFQYQAHNCAVILDNGKLPIIERM